MAHFTPLVFMLWLGLAGGSVLHLQKRVIGGQECAPDERLYHVKLLITDGQNTNFCGGSLISDQWILTAAHCRKPGRRIYAVLGVHPGGGQPEPIREPPVIYYDDQGREHDIMMLRLPGTTNIVPVPLPDCRRSLLAQMADCFKGPRCKQPPVNKKVQVAGHASTHMGPNNEREPDESPTLQCADVQVVNCQRLRHIKALTVPARLYQHWFCVQSPGKDICFGDSGGGVLYKGELYGVVSFTGDPDYACTEAAGMMNVCSYMEWITEVLNTPRGTPNNPPSGSGRNG